MRTKTSFILVIIFIMAAGAVFAQSPREQLQQMAEQLQKTPNDHALREKIIKLAPTLKPFPALPYAAITFEGRAQFAFKSANSEDDFLAAAQEYEKAVAVAPWVLGYYTDLCTIYEKAGKFEDAKRHCEFYLIGLTDPAQMTDVKRRIAGLEFGIEKINSPKAREATLLEKVEGARFTVNTTMFNPDISYDEIYEIKGGTMYMSVRIYSLGPNGVIHGYTKPGEYSIARIPYRDGAFKFPWPNGAGFESFTIREDGMAFTKTSISNSGKSDAKQYPRQ